MKILSLSQKVAAAAFVLCILTTVSQAQDKSLNPWQDISSSSVVSTGTRYIIPDMYRTTRLNLESLKQLLVSAPMESTPGASLRKPALILPMPDGVNQGYYITESPIMEPALAAQYPELKTYLIEGVDKSYGFGRIDCTPLGFHAIIFTASGTVYIDPFSFGDTRNYISYFTKDYSNPAKRLAHTSCTLENDGSAEREINYILQNDKPLEAIQLRTYRLALACTGEYAAYYGGTTIGAMNGIVTSMNRVNAVYMRDLAIKMNLVANNSSIVYTNASTDPYTNNNGSTMLTQNQTTCDNIIGTANYDIGHVFSTGGGGIAGLGVVCKSGQKARGVTGGPAPVGDPFDIDYVAHEMGHQYGANHTFNSVTSSCGGGNRNASTAYEPGSGTTIMAYAGICGSDDLQPNSDDHFHHASLAEIVAYTRSGSGSTCPVNTATGNNTPTVTVPTGGFTIPFKTPFALTGSATDPENDVMSYCWEEYDLGPAGSANAPSGNAPIFRSFKPVISPTRTFPKLANLLNNSTTIGELLPTYARSLAFRLTVRDNNAAGGGYSYGSLSFSVTDQAGPFLVTSPNTNVSWEGNSSREITWNVANTSGSPVNCAQVNIRLSTDGGTTWPLLLAGTTPNDGSEFVTIPNIPTTSARIKVEAVNNVFFDISNTNFTITAGGSTLTVVSPLVEGWNMVSVPVITTDMSAAALFPQANSAVYGYNNGYTTQTTLATGKGYWVRYPSAQSIIFSGNSAGVSTVNLTEGWNMIGVYHTNVSTANISTTPAGIINSSIYGFNNGYFSAFSLASGQGYWVRATQAGVMNLGVIAKSGVVTIPSVDDSWQRITVSDAAGNTRKLYLAKNNVNTKLYELPPSAPGRFFDARFANNSIVESAEAGAKDIVMNDAAYPVTISATNAALRVWDKATGGKLVNVTLRPGESTSIHNPGISAVSVTAISEAVAYELAQNYPNPFNPTTAIRFALPEKASVSLRVFNQLGEQVAVLANGEFDAGYHSVQWNAVHLTSGIYFYELKTEKFLSVKKLMLMK